MDRSRGSLGHSKLRFLLAFLVLGLAACGPGSEPVLTGKPSPPPQITSQGYPKYADADPHPWKGRAPWQYPVHGLDVARFQGTISWFNVRDAGIKFAYIKATEGGDLLDPQFRENWRETRRVGIRRGAYHFYYFCRPAEDQARWFIRNVPRDGQALPHVLDMEWNPFSPTCTLRPDGAVVRAEARKFLDMLEAHYGKRPIIYTTPDFYDQTGIGQIKGTEFWLRSVADSVSNVYPGQSWRIWQYTGTGLVPGVIGEVDINVFNGTPEAWEAWGR